MNENIMSLIVILNKLVLKWSIICVSFMWQIFLLVFNEYNESSTMIGSPFTNKLQLFGWDKYFIFF